MIYKPKIYTVESVTAGHPDKICDQISDAILDACLEQDPMSRVAMEAFGGHGLLIVGGEVTTKAKVDFEKVARDVYKEIGYMKDIKVITNVVKQSPDIAQGVDTGGAGDQGIMYGYATDETPELLPHGVVLVNKLTKGLENLRTSGEIAWLGPDGKAQVTIDETRGGKVRSILISTQHDENIIQEEIRKALIEKLVKPISGDISGIEILVNPTGKFAIGGFEGDTGLTGRKIMVDTYGGLIPHGGGCFSGKDPTKVDRSAAYMARYVAKTLVSEGKARECLVSVAYAIGRAEPLMVEALNEKGESIREAVEERFDFKPNAIIKKLDLRRPIYKKTAAYGHFGRDEFPWEKVG
ncbi:MAG: methionine adenosyltransferase, S-adenosylmethionine synthetase [Candidatus Moranbacteria bacterium GW2011_GWC1_45_18]|nr:MAG: S-adenosylmethionine synthase [Candidatus Moranbacteria bacterium GW2011_GWC2_40_12]KKT33911.1 MAG: S-adenosylmethionine synthase [Candidatus Moranbacteria bacterium GW2011_GWF2_44_10]KKT99811.1 MAG: methionine adenosyltransferase, S-adenosylmethionine synthetase [Candidatus Moranbacteria bacterium GW2011_GWC1_45_18]OGI34989.1 MAG: methionine adenosyltransferase [Candidatus Moranbacteria bacterium RIFOXYC1_FULL_44_8]OGI39552.1 MAG: methionine adenosyltransferase [Candidatus Moranbacteri